MPGRNLRREQTAAAAAAAPPEKTALVAWSLPRFPNVSDAVAKCTALGPVGIFSEGREAKKLHNIMKAL